MDEEGWRYEALTSYIRKSALVTPAEHQPQPRFQPRHHGKTRDSSKFGWLLTCLHYPGHFSPIWAHEPLDLLTFWSRKCQLMIQPVIRLLAPRLFIFLGSAPDRGPHTSTPSSFPGLQRIRRRRCDNQSGSGAFSELSRYEEDRRN